MFIAVPEAVDNNGAAILDASLSVDNIIEDMSNAILTASECGPECSGFSRRCRVFRMGEEETRPESELQRFLYRCYSRRRRGEDELQVTFGRVYI
jgi:hypothetical protein